MKISELRYNPAKQKQGGWYRDVPKGTPGANPKWKQDPNTGKWGPSDEYHEYVTNEPHVDQDGKPVLTKTFNEPHFRPRINQGYNNKTHTRSPKWGELSRGGKKGEGHILGTVGDWLTQMGAGREDIAPARFEVLASPEYKELTGRLEFVDVSSPADVKNGTIALEGELHAVIGSEEEAQKFRRKILANGQIRAHSAYGGHVNTHHGWRPATFHPFTIENSPDLSPHERIVLTMRQSLAQLVRHYKGAAVRHFKKTVSPKDD